ncbi:hypothetical protein M2273_005370 [Mucilaginibacter lappiensis]
MPSYQTPSAWLPEYKLFSYTNRITCKKQWMIRTAFSAIN